MAKKYAPFSRREMRRRQRAWRRRNRQRLALATLLFVVMVGLATAIILAVRMPSDVRWYVLGLFHAAMAATYYWFTSVAVLAGEQDAIRHLRGAWGEENTRDELKRAKRRRIVWDWVDSISFQNGDLDHVVVTRRGGLVVLDSKWRNQTNIHDRDAMVRAARRAQQRCEALAIQKLGKDRVARHRARARAFSVRPAVVVWGAAQRQIGDARMVDGVAIVPGQKLVAWLRGLDGDAVEKRAAREAVRKLRDYRAQSWESATATERGSNAAAVD
jgi:hypothetical protein